MFKNRLHVVLVALSCCAGAVSAQDNCDAACQAARDAQDPLAPIRGVLTDNTLGYGPKSSNDSYNYQLQPVYSIEGEQGNIILRGVIQYVGVPTGAGGRNSGLGDTILQGFWVPGNQDGFKFGYGPQVSLDTKENQALGGPGNGVGLALVGFGFAGDLSFGGIVSHLEGEDNFSVSTIQPIIYYNMDLFGGSYVGYNNSINYNWSGTSNNKWTVPLGATFGKTFLTKSGLAIDTSVGAYKQVTRPSGSNDTQFKFALSFILP